MSERAAGASNVDAAGLDDFLAGVDTLVALLRKRAEERPERTRFTFLDDGENEGQRLSYAELDRQARAVAALLQDAGLAGQRALLIYPPGLEFLSAFFGCLYGGVVAVPVYPPDPARLERTLGRLRGITQDAGATVVLTTRQVLTLVDAFRATDPGLGKLRYLATDQLSVGDEANWREPVMDADSVAFLQYTSGSTAAPKGVVMTHRNLLANQRVIRDVFGQGEDAVAVSWLPLYHDMGLIGHVIHPMYIGATQYLMSPLAFLQRPARWLKAISRYRVTITGAPNFGYDLTVRRATESQRAELDLSSWRLAFNGAEPIRIETMRRFADAFAACGFRWEAFSPCYGLAEATLAVTGSILDAAPRVLSVDRAELEAHRVVAQEGGQELVGCGPAPAYPELAIVDPQTFRRAESDRVGEIWLTGEHVARGYWGRSDETAQTFEARIVDDPGAGPFLRTGDYGFVRDGELYVTGRLKDVIIVGGRNYYPQDLEQAAEAAHASVRAGCVAAFSAVVDDEERVIVVAEVSHPIADAEAVKLAIRQALVETHGLSAYAVVLVKPRSLYKTSSGKIRRLACRAAYVAGTLG